MKNYLFIGIIALILVVNIFVGKAYNEHYDNQLIELQTLSREAGMLQYKRQIMLEAITKGDTLLDFAAIDSAYAKTLFSIP